MRKITCLVLLLALLTAVCAIPAFAEEAVYANTKAALAAMDKYNLVYTLEGVDGDGDEEVVITHKTDASEYTIHMFFPEDDETVSIRVWDVIAFDSSVRSAVLETVNDLNCSYRFLRFRADSDNTVTVSIDLIVRAGNGIGDIVLEALGHIQSIVDEAYPELAVFNS